MERSRLAPKQGGLYPAMESCSYCIDEGGPWRDFKLGCAVVKVQLKGVLIRSERCTRGTE